MKAFLDFKSPRLLEKLRKANQLKVKQPEKQLNTSNNNGLLFEPLEKEVSAGPAKKQLMVKSQSDNRKKKEVDKTHNEILALEPPNKKVGV